MPFSNGTQINNEGQMQTLSVAEAYVPVVSDVFINGVLHDVNGVMYVSNEVPSIPRQFINGILHTRDGVRYIAPPPAVNDYPEGFSTDANGAMIVTDSFDPPINYTRGIALSAGSVFVSDSGGGSVLDNRLLDDLNLDEYLLDDTNTDDVYLLDGAPFIAAKTADAYALGVSAGNPEGITGSFRYDWDFKSDGLKAYTWRNGTIASSSFREYTLTTPFAFTGWVFVSSTLIGGSNARTFEWSPDGTVLCTLQRWFSSNYRLINYDQSATPWASAVLGAGTVGTNIAVGSFHVCWRPDGLLVFVEHGAGILDAQTVGVAFDASTLTTSPVATFDSTVDAGARSFTMAFSNDGLILYSVTSTNLLCSWDLTAPYDISAPFNFKTGVSVILPTPLQIPRGLFYRPDNGEILLARDQSSQNVRSFV